MLKKKYVNYKYVNYWDVWLDELAIEILATATRGRQVEMEVCNMSPSGKLIH